jgi:hypothetical protein
MQEVANTSYDQKPRVFVRDSRMKSKWIQLAGSDSHLLHESRRTESFEPTEEVFEKRP